MSEPERVQLDPYVREIGRIETTDDDIVVGVDYDTVVIDSYGSRLTQAQQEEFAQLFVSAVWQAGQQKARMDAEAHDVTDRPTDRELAAQGFRRRCGCRMVGDECGDSEEHYALVRDESDG